MIASVRSRRSGFVSHPVMGAQVGLIGWLFIASSLAIPVYKAGALGSLPWTFWVLAVAGLVVSVAAGLAACEGILFVQILGAAASFVAVWMTTAEDGKSFYYVTALVAGMAPALLYFVWDLVSRVRQG